MADDEDFARMLPGAPPPRPDRRDTTIAMAMRRFDGQPEPVASTASPTKLVAPRWRLSAGAAAFASLLLVVAISVSVALRNPPWRWAAPQGERRTAASEGYAARPTARSTPCAPAPCAIPPADAAAPTMADESASTTTNASDAVAPAPPARAKAAGAGRAPAPALPVAVTAPAPVMALAPSPPPPPAPAPVAKPAPALVAERAANAASMADRYDDSGVGDVVVTGARVTRKAAVAGRRGDWNACTVNDPARNLRTCRGSIDPNARGDTGIAARHLADGLGLAWRGEWEQAVGAFGQAIAIKPKLALGYLNRGLAYQRLGELGKAAADLDRAVRYAPNAARAYYSRSVVRALRGDRRGAKADADRAVELDSSYEAVTD